MNFDKEQREKQDYFIDSVKDAWINTIQAAAVVSALLAGTAAQFLGTVTGATMLPGPGLNACLIFSYGAIVLNTGATITSLALLDLMSSLPLRDRSRFPNELDQWAKDKFERQPISAIMEVYEIRTTYRALVAHWLLCLFSGIIFFNLQIITFIGLNVPPVIIILLACTVVGSLLSLPYFFHHSKHNTHETIAEAQCGEVL
ncbi:hypothetical protein BT96DRAFT_1024018 [Gymnopus androsaceus JB14]|uniref:Uncharacterized protein n=1 Tax=Gymnopus androsaceus JB14 TaxID=1447944 RepID=A0A6A4H1H7_9AGAR|nr:hypothetical protein BT96DRAFT_1024018 [Gymnopus androsaceus JB14]